MVVLKKYSPGLVSILKSATPYYHGILPSSCKMSAYKLVKDWEISYQIIDQSLILIFINIMETILISTFLYTSEESQTYP